MQKSRIKKQTQLTLAKALEDDPTAFLYDEVYDEIHARKPDRKEAEMKDEKKNDGERAVEKAKVIPFHLFQESSSLKKLRYANIFIIENHYDVS